MATFNSVASAIKTELDALSGFPTTSIRQVFHIKPRDTLPIVILSLRTDASDAWGTTGDGAADLGDTGKDFTVAVSYIASDQGDTETGLSTVPDFWQLAKRAINSDSLGAVAGVWNVTPQTSEAWERQPFADGKEVSEFIIRVGVSENRN